MNEQQTGPDKSSSAPTDSGFTYTIGGNTLRVFLTTLPSNTSETIDPEKHIKLDHLKNSLAAIRHARWFEENAFQSSIRVMVRILKDFKRRIPFFKNVNPWTINLLAHHSASMTGTQLTIPLVFRRCLQLLAAGILLPGSASISDPCEPGFVKAHSFMTYEQQDELACGAQTLLRALAHGGFKEILGIKGARKVTFDAPVMFDGVIVTPSKLAYEKAVEPGTVCVCGLYGSAIPHLILKWGLGTRSLAWPYSHFEHTRTQNCGLSIGLTCWYRRHLTPSRALARGYFVANLTCILTNSNIQTLFRENGYSRSIRKVQPSGLHNPHPGNTQPDTSCSSFIFC
eukprot:sb/3466422/